MVQAMSDHEVYQESEKECGERFEDLPMVHRGSCWVAAVVVTFDEETVPLVGDVHLQDDVGGSES